MHNAGGMGVASKELLLAHGKGVIIEAADFAKSMLENLEKYEEYDTEKQITAKVMKCAG